MSTSYRTSEQVRFDAFIEGLKHACLKEKQTDNTKPDARFIQLVEATDDGGLWCYSCADGDDVAFTRYGIQPACTEIIERIMAFYAVELISEHDDRYHEEADDCDDEGDWNAAAAIVADESRPMSERSAALRRIDAMTGEVSGDYSAADVERFVKERAEVLGLNEQADKIADVQDRMNNAIADLIDDEG